MLIDCVEDASIAMCENAQALASIQVWMKRKDRSIYEISVLISVSVLFDFRLFELFYKLY